MSSLATTSDDGNDLTPTSHISGVDVVKDADKQGAVKHGSSSIQPSPNKQMSDDTESYFGGENSTAVAPVKQDSQLTKPTEDIFENKTALWRDQPYNRKQMTPRRTQTKPHLRGEQHKCRPEERKENSKHLQESTDRSAETKRMPLSQPECNLMSKQMSLSGTRIYKSSCNDYSVLVYEKDITKVHVDVIVSASTGYLSNETGVSKAIVAAAGASIQLECGNISKHRGYIRESQVEVTTGGSLWKKIIHAVGPVQPHSYTQTYASITSRDKIRHGLRVTFSNCLEVADKLKMQSIAIPGIGSGRSTPAISLVASHYLLPRIGPPD